MSAEVPIEIALTVDLHWPNPMHHSATELC